MVNKVPSEIMRLSLSPSILLSTKVPVYEGPSRRIYFNFPSSPFETLITHERLEIIAISGESKRYNSHHEDFARTPEGFHKYIRNGSDFAEFVSEQGYSPEVVDSQKNLYTSYNILSDIKLKIIVNNPIIMI